MSSYDDQDHYDIQFSTRQLALLFGLLVVIVGGVFVGGIVIGRNMSHEAREVIAARRSGGPIVPPPPAPSPVDAVEEPATSAPPETRVNPPIVAAPEPTPTPAPTRPSPRAETSVAEAEPASPPPPAATPPASTPAPAPAAPTASEGQFTIQVAAFRDRAAAESLLARIGELGLEGYLEGTPAGIFRVRVGRFATREEARRVAARLEAEQLAALVTSR